MIITGQGRRGTASRCKTTSALYSHTTSQWTNVNIFNMGIAYTNEPPRLLNLNMLNQSLAIQKRKVESDGHPRTTN